MTDKFWYWLYISIGKRLKARGLLRSGGVIVERGPSGNREMDQKYGKTY